MCLLDPPSPILFLTWPSQLHVSLFFFKSPIKQISDAHMCMDIHKSWSIETISGPMLRKKNGFLSP